MTVITPPTLELGSVRDHHQQRDCSSAINQEIEHFKTGRVCPVSVLEQHDGGLLVGCDFDEICEYSKRLILESLRRNIQWTIAFDRKREHCSDEAHIFAVATVAPDN